MSKARDIADGTRYVDVTGDTMTGQLDTPYQVIKGDIDYIGMSIRNTKANYSTSFIDAQNRTNAADSHIFFHHETDGSSTISFGTQSAGDFTDRRISGRMLINGNGHVLMPYQPLFSASDTRSLVFSSITQLDSSNCFNSIDYNVGNHFNPSNGRYTAPVAGYYDCTFHCADASTSGKETNMRIKKNGVSNTGPLTEAYNQAGLGSTNVFVRCIVQCNAGDYISFEAAMLNTVTGVQHKRFIIHLLG